MKSRHVPEVLSIEQKYKAFRVDEDDEQAFLFTCGSCSSALDVAWGLNEEGLFRPWDSVFAVEQTAGRGQLRREWVSPKGNIYAALCLPPLLHGAGASVYVGWLVVKALFEVLGQNLPKPKLAGLKLKWPNDVVLDMHKIGGILLEEKNGVLVAGIGINFSFAPGADKMRENYALPAGSLQNMLEYGDFLKNISAETLWLSLVSMLRFWYETKVPFTGGGIPHYLIEPQLAFLREVVRICEFFDKSDDHSKEEHERTGRILGLGPNAELRLETSGGEVLLSSGSICPL